MKVYSTLSGKKEEFLPQGDAVKIYVCGVTPYSDCHIGHAMSYVIFDVVRRYLLFRSYQVKYVQNVTDIDDKIIDRANQLGISTSDLAGKFTDSLHQDMKNLNVLPPDIEPKATEEIAEVIKVVQGLMDKGYAYPAGGSVYFRVNKVVDYGKLSHRVLESMMSAEGALGSEEKESSIDFVLWKSTKPGEPSWPSPWGEGRPGWHIECSVMSLKYLGETIDIHGGGQDLVFPHHENEIAQSESYTGIKPFVKHWMHNGLVQLGVEKMSKSLGNLVTIKEALEKYSPDAIRLFILNSHYRSPLTYAEETLEAAIRGVERLRQAVNRETEGGKPTVGINPEAYRKRFINAMDDDFNTPQAIAVLFDLARDINRLSDEGYEVTSPVGGGFMQVEVAAGQTVTGKDFEFSPYGTMPSIAGTVTFNNGSAASNVYVVAEHSWEESPEGFLITYTDGSGNFLFDNVLDGDYQVGVYYEGYSSMPPMRYFDLWGMAMTGQDFVLTQGTGVESKFSLLTPKTINLAQNFPNPFNPRTTINFDLPTAAQVEVNIFNATGQKIRTLVNNSMNAGSHQVEWNSRNDAGQKVSSGVYLYQLKTNNYTKVMKMILAK